MLPFSYNENRLIMLPVDPNTLFAYWDFTKDTWDRMIDEGATHLHLVLHSNGSFRAFGTECNTRNFYFKGVPANREYVLELGFGVHGRVVTLMESSPVTTPADRPSDNRLVQFKRFHFMAPPAQPGHPSANWREFYRRSSGRWGIYGNLAGQMDGTTHERKASDTLKPAPTATPNRPIYYYDQGAEFSTGGSSGNLPSSPHPIGPSSHSVLQNFPVGGFSSDFKKGGQYRYGEEESGENSGNAIPPISDRKIEGEIGGVSSSWSSYFGPSSHSPLERGGSSSTSPLMTARFSDGKSKE
jgi:hypothetical protein